MNERHVVPPKSSQLLAERHGHFDAGTVMRSDAAAYDRARALFPADIVAWIQTAQPNAWATLVKNHGAAADWTPL